MGVLANNATGDVVARNYGLEAPTSKRCPEAPLRTMTLIPHGIRDKQGATDRRGLCDGIGGAPHPGHAKMLLARRARGAATCNAIRDHLS